MYYVLQAASEAVSIVQPSACATPKAEWSGAIEQFAASAAELSWNLLTTAPPLVVSCPAIAFCRECHEKEPPPLWSEGARDKSVVYYRPVLYHSCEGKVARPGWVGTLDKGSTSESWTLVDKQGDADCSPSTPKGRAKETPLHHAPSCLIHSKKNWQTALCTSSSSIPPASSQQGMFRPGQQACPGAERGLDMSQLRQLVEPNAQTETRSASEDENKIVHVHSMFV